MNEIWKCLLIYQFNIWNCCMNHIIIYLWIHALLFDRFNCMHINIYENMHSNLINLIACIYRYIHILHGKILDLFAYIVKGICDICLKDILIMLLIIDLMCYFKVLTYGCFPLQQYTRFSFFFALLDSIYQSVILYWVSHFVSIRNSILSSAWSLYIV